MSAYKVICPACNGEGIFGTGGDEVECECCDGGGFDLTFDERESPEVDFGRINVPGGSQL